MNSTVLVGRVGRDAEIRYFESGKVKANFSIAVNRWDAKTKSEVADWFNIDVWDKLPETIEKTSMYLQTASDCWVQKEIFKRYSYDYQF